MSIPPPGGWQPPTPPNQGQPYGQPFDPAGHDSQQQPPPPGWQQGGWAPQPGQPPPKGNSLKWLLIGVAVLLVIGISVGATLLLTRGGGGGGGGGTTQTSGASSDIASANDTGPVAIVTDEPTCAGLNKINGALADVQANGWSSQRANLGAASQWTADQRAQVQAVATAMKNASDQMVPLAKETPHRVVRELYEQFIAYGRAYADSIANYSPLDDALATVNVSIGTALLGICSAIQYGSADRSLAVETAVAPANVAKPSDLNDPRRFVVTPSPICAAWVQRENKFIADTAAWATLDTNLTAAEWTPEQHAIQQGVLPVLTAMASDMLSAGKTSANSTLEDFAALGSEYFQAYVSTGDSYTGADSWLSYTASRLNNVVGGACSAVAG